MNERALVELARAGDEAAFEKLVTLYERKVYATAFRYTANEHDAMDISQEVFIRVFRFIHTFNLESSFSTWIYRITVNVCKDHIRKRASRAELPLELTDEESGEYTVEISDSTYDPVELYEQAELRQEIRRAIDDLPDNYKEIVLLRDIGGLSYDEISQTLDIEVGTVKSRLSRAREKLRNFLLQNGNKPFSFRSKE
ncbi:MAG: sigma-70 family RNA polymerase sigma factor [Clostridia bacterium]|nr:sigma-70 family RNA polymerase sigma factor [Clostridia bacterium]MBQ5760873.1 sigma-70 family RNA polymerase sigma factor [Clostridia bacterium]